MKRYYKISGIVLAVLLAISLVWYFLIRKTVKPRVLQSQYPVYGYIAQSVTATGKIEPVDTVTVGSQVSGIIKYLYVDFNSKVKKGELLAELDKSLLQATLDQFNGNLQSAMSQRLYAENNFSRQNQLFKADAISKADYDIALNTLNAAKAAVASVAAQVRSAKKNLSYTDIYSPIDGVVLNRNINIGQTVAASFSTPTLFVIAKDITKMEVDANVDEADIGEVKAGERAIFTVDAFINDKFIGTVKDIRLRPSVSANVVTYTTIINAPNDDMKLKPGMTANIVIYTKEVEHTLLIPVKAIKFTPDSSLKVQYHLTGDAGYDSKAKLSGGTSTSAKSAVKNRTDSIDLSAQAVTIWLLQGKKMVMKKIKIGLNNNTQVEVLSGLTPADLVVTGVLTSGASQGAKASTASTSPFMPKQQKRGGRAK
ncbi:efflux RND transporter periplasmic adaptor subunit [Mucilaginibacter paludis]|uniref:Efflux transporter, RND family, MFP subunit n=1 Tax=Mucilaginibacter paludis DSM 18603 TaxID=714943 RepID=H1Y626_9SPHI|nr:efflux RND transporter periplasmic adaptor subunit [Mucilaginibacter paludis]EHQ30985.1 efflux transporter, RND family, MFP subunit [Mucilaginibacter paludis DSM 18603]